jgi:hypothetical protein
MTLCGALLAVVAIGIGTSACRYLDRRRSARLDLRRRCGGPGEHRRPERALVTNRFVVLALVLAPSSVLAADDVANLVLIDGAVAVDRVLPSGKSVSVQLAAPGADDLVAELEFWPTAFDCATPPPRPVSLAMATSGSGATRVLGAVLPPLQVDTRYCLRVTMSRALRNDQLDLVSRAVADGVADQVAWLERCAVATINPIVAGAIANALNAVHPSLGSAGELTTTQTNAVAAALLSAVNTRDSCPKVQDAATAAKLAVAAKQAVDAELEQAYADVKRRIVAAPAKLKAWPAVVVDRAGMLTVVGLREALAGTTDDLERISHQLVSLDAKLAGKIHDLALDDLATRQAAVNGWPVLPPKELPFAINLTAKDPYVFVKRLDAPELWAVLVADAGTSPRIVDQLEQWLSQVPTDDARKAHGLELVNSLLTMRTVADKNRSALEALKAAHAAQDAVGAEIRAAVAAAAKNDVIRNALRMTTIYGSVPMTTAIPAGTDDKASWISPNIGVAVAIPHVDHDGGSGFADPWLVPYAGASIYFQRVDRVIHPRDLVGKTFWQENSFSVGVWLKKPELRQVEVDGVWKSGPVPYLGFGHRFTPYVRLDVGAAFFRYAGRLPTVSDRSLGWAMWIGASIDADVWALVKGKL